MLYCLKKILFFLVISDSKSASSFVISCLRPGSTIKCAAIEASVYTHANMYFMLFSRLHYIFISYFSVSLYLNVVFILHFLCLLSYLEYLCMSNLFWLSIAIYVTWYHKFWLLWIFASIVHELKEFANFGWFTLFATVFITHVIDIICLFYKLSLVFLKYYFSYTKVELFNIKLQPRAISSPLNSVIIQQVEVL